MKQISIIQVEKKYQITGYDDENKSIILIERNYFKKGDIVEIFTPDNKIYNYEIDKIYDEDMKEQEVANHPDQVLKLPFDIKVPEYSMMRLIKKQ